MKWTDARYVVERIRQERALWLPALSQRRGFSSTRVEHLLNRLLSAMPDDETYLEVGTLEGRTLEAAAHGNENKRIVACDPGTKYGSDPDGLPSNVRFYQQTWQDTIPFLKTPVGLAFYDGDHSTHETARFLAAIEEYAASEIIVVLDDWDRDTVREAALEAFRHGWALVAEMPEYGDGITNPPNHFGYYHGVGIIAWRR